MLLISVNHHMNIDEYGRLYKFTNFLPLTA